ncbi:MAG TPA: maleylacetate reductase [Caulobacteraceae bacterium]|jgi:alcohol dehydrogenase class IV|nr:maleylacetate reductase [Caulobacteraceae bacterium]
MQPFSYTALPGKVVFGSGTLARVADEIRALGCSRALLLSTPQQVDQVRRLQAQLGDLAAGLFAEATMHTPVEVTERAMQAAQACRADCTVALGGGSTTGLGKAIALRTDLPQVVIPTTYAGSEATPILGQTENGLKTTVRDLKVLPEVIIYDVDLTLTLPVGLTVTSGMNAIAHAAEGLYARDANPIVSMLAEDGTRAIARALPAIVADPDDIEARGDALYGAWACGVTLGVVGMALHHKLCHTLGGTFDLPHAETHTVVLPHAMAYNAPAAPEAMARIARAIGAPSAPQGLYDLAKSLGAPTSLRELGMPQDGLDRVVDLALANPYWNPRPLEREPLRRLLDDAWHGRRPPEAI